MYNILYFGLVHIFHRPPYHAFIYMAMAANSLVTAIPVAELLTGTGIGRQFISAASDVPDLYFAVPVYT